MSTTHHALAILTLLAVASCSERGPSLVTDDVLVLRRKSDHERRTVTVEALPAAAQRPEGSEVTEPSAKSPR
jgi:hypothetical protein